MTAQIDNLYDFENWEDIDMNTNILRGIYAYGFEKPSPIQKKAILPILHKKDLIAQAQSGTGKTAAFSIGALSRVDVNIRSTQILILSPTKELTIQTSNVLQGLGKMVKGLQIQTLYGGLSYDKKNSFSDKYIPHIICACPGRVYDLIRKKEIASNDIKLLILDEADELLSNEFSTQIYNIFQHLSYNIQVALFSATFPESVMPIINKIVRTPIKIQVNAEMLTLEGISQYYVALENDRQKYNMLKELYNYISVSQCIIYCNSLKRVEDLYEAMNEDAFPVCKIHSNMDSLERKQAFDNFKNGKYRVLISSNVTSRGIDIQQVSIVINFDIPKDKQNYLHRIGRSGRWGRKGVGINFVTKNDISILREIEQFYACEIREMPSTVDEFTKKI